MKKLLLLTFSVVSILVSSLASVIALRAQEAGSIVSLSALGGVQESSLTGIKSGEYYSVRGSLLNFFAELRHDEWGNTASYVRDNGLVAGADFSLFNVMVSGGIGIGQLSYQAQSVFGVAPPVLSYSTFIYEGQAMYQFTIIKGLLSAGAGVNYVAESNNIADITGWGGVIMVSVVL